MEVDLATNKGNPWAARCTQQEIDICYRLLENKKNEKAAPVGGIMGAGITYEGHGNARDIAADEGTPIYAAMSGIVKDVVMIYDNHMNWNPAYKTGIPSMSSGMQSYGNYIDILLWDGTTIRYAHQQQSSFVKKGDVVNAGRQIGILGNTGNSTGPTCIFKL